jgi:hypothetical protein
MKSADRISLELNGPAGISIRAEERPKILYPAASRSLDILMTETSVQSRA